MTRTIYPSDLGTTVPRRSRIRPRHYLVLAALLAFAAAATVVVVVRYLDSDARRQYLSSNGWPAVGQGAYQVGDGGVAVSPRQRPAPIASLAKVMTALIVLEHHPLADGQSGPTFVVRHRDVVDTARRRQRDESVVAVRAGERLTERQALLGLLLPSANNLAALLAREVDGSVGAFVADMNHEASRLGMTQTHYTDPSGFDPGTVSTSVDQLLLARAATATHTLAALVATRTADLPVAGTVHNTDQLLGTGGFVGVKTGSDDAAGGCFMFLAYRSIGGYNTPILGVVLGQPGHNLIDAGQYAARQLVNRIAPTAAHP
jgi:D-alanyl-D-alanine carboxypeptidase (penicillin-binding protein 5/6)